jgi:hypothetical protein
MKLSIEQKGNYQYAKIPGKSVRINGKVRKTGVTYLGRVIDLSKGVFCSKERGVYTFDVNTGEYGTADPSYLGGLPCDRRKKEKLILDFGDAFLVDEFIRNIGYDKVLESIGYGNPDTLKTMVTYYIVSEKALFHSPFHESNRVFPAIFITTIDISHHLGILTQI